MEPPSPVVADGSTQDAGDAWDHATVGDVADSRVPERVTRTFVIAGSSDDALQDPGGTMQVAYDWVSLYSPSHLGGLRFVLADIPRNATIESADLTVWVDSPMEDDPALLIARDARQNPPGFSTLNSDLQRRSLAPERVQWTGTSVGMGPVQAPSLVSLLQPLVADPGFRPGNAIALVFLPTSAAGTGRVFEFRQIDFGASFAARLTLVYLRP